MMTYDATMITFDIFYDACMEFWLGEGKPFRQADYLAMMDVKAAKTNPFSPNGEELDPKGKEDFIKLYSTGYDEY